MYNYGLRMAIANLRATAKLLFSSDRKILDEAIWTALDDQISKMKLVVEVTFEHGWMGRHYSQTETSPEEFPEFQTSHERAVVKPAVNAILFGKIKEVVLQELLKQRHQLDKSPEELVESDEFLDALKAVVKSDDFATLEDVDVELPGGNFTFATVNLNLTVVGMVVKVVPTLAAGELDTIIETVNKNAGDWYAPEEPDYDDRDD